MEKILAALKQLDPNNENHWTAEGLPRIETVRMFANDQGITREAITQAAPEFNRQATTVQPVPAEPAAKPAAPKAQQDIDYDAMIARGNEVLAELGLELAEAQQRYNDCQAKLDELINAKHASGAGETTMTTIQGYLASQRKLGEEEAEKRKILRDNNITAKDILALMPQKSPLDQSMAGKRS